MSKSKEIDRAVVAMLIEQYGFSQLMFELEDYCYHQEHHAINSGNEVDERKWGNRRQYFASLINQ